MASFMDSFDASDWGDFENFPNLTLACQYIGKSRPTLMRRIIDGTLVSVMVRGEHRVSRGDLDALYGPVPVLGAKGTPQDESLRLWAQRIAKAAPPLHPEQRELVLAALSDAFVVTGGD